MSSNTSDINLVPNHLDKRQIGFIQSAGKTIWISSHPTE